MVKDKVKLPVKIKIAAWLMFVAPIISFTAFMRYIHYVPADPTVIGMAGAGIIITHFIGLLILVIPGIFLMWKRKWAWCVAATALSGGFIGAPLAELTIEGELALSIIYIPVFAVPLLLLLLDVKNYWRIATWKV